MSAENLSPRQVQAGVQELWATYGRALQDGVTPEELTELQALKPAIAALEADLAADGRASKAQILVSAVPNPTPQLAARSADVPMNTRLQLARRLGDLRQRIALVGSGTPALALHVSSADANHDGRVTQAETSAFLGEIGLSHTGLAATLTLKGASHAAADDGEGLLLSRLAGQDADLFDKRGRVAMNRAAQWFAQNGTGPADDAGQPTITHADIQAFIKQAAEATDKDIQHTLRSAVAFNFLFGVAAVRRDAGEGKLVKSMTLGDLQNFASGNLFDDIIQRRIDARYARPTTGVAAAQREDLLAEKNTLKMLDAAIDITMQQHPGAGAILAGGGLALGAGAFFLNPILGVGITVAVAYPAARGGWSAIKGVFKGE